MDGRHQQKHKTKERRSTNFYSPTLVTENRQEVVKNFSAFYFHSPRSSEGTIKIAQGRKALPLQCARSVETQEPSHRNKN